MSIEITCRRCGRRFRVKNYRARSAQYCQKACMLEPAADRFWKKVDKVSSPFGCWLWTGAVSDDGYGYFRTVSAMPMQMAHRVAWVLEYGPIPAGLNVLHDCPGGDNPACVRHLWLGTQKDNMMDAASKGRVLSQTHPERINRGEDHWNAKLTSAIVEDIKKRLLAGDTMYSIAKDLQIGAGSVLKIRDNKLWAHVPWPC